MIQLHRSEWQDTIAQAVLFATTLKDVDSSRIGLLGFSLGGHLCLRLRATPKVLVEFFAPKLDGLGPSGPLTLHVQIHHADLDTIDNPEEIEAELRASGASTTVCLYKNVGHGFVGNDPAKTDALTKSKALTMAFFGTHL